MATSHPLRIEGYKLYAFLDCIDDIGHPFWLAAIPYPGKTAFFYQFRFRSAIPDFESHGLSIQPTDQGDLLFLTQPEFLKLTAQYGSISITSGNWRLALAEFRRSAALAHVDVLPRLSRLNLRHFDSLEAQSLKFHSYYDPPGVPATTLGTLYSEIRSLLILFGFADDSLLTFPDPNEYCFGALRGPVQAFQRSCFPGIALGSTCLTPGLARQLRALAHFVSEGLQKVGYPADQLFEAVRKFQIDENLPEGPCGVATLNRLWTKVMGSVSDCLKCLDELGVSIPATGETGSQRFGEIDGSKCDEAGERIAVGLSRSVATAPAPSVVVAAAQGHLLRTSKSAGRQFQPIIEASAVVDRQLREIVTVARDMRQETMETEENAAAALEMLAKLTEKNREVDAQLAVAKQNLENELNRTNLLALLLLGLVAALVLQWYFR
jgi:hypothetical protein